LGDGKKKKKTKNQNPKPKNQKQSKNNEKLVQGEDAWIGLTSFKGKGATLQQLL
jgi:hypothetical protein